MGELTILGIKPLTNQMGEQFYPKTTTDAVFQSDSDTGQATETTLTQILDTKADAPSSMGGGVSNFLTYNKLTNQLEDSGYNEESFATASQGAKADTAYQKPQTGIPGTDLSSDVQSQLNKHFKGWFNTLAELKAAHTAVEGDSAYVKNASPATTWSIYVYDSTASSDNYWADSGTDADTSNVQTFASGEEVNEVRIVNDLTTGGSEDVLSAEQGKKVGNYIKNIFGEGGEDYFDLLPSTLLEAGSYASITYTKESGKLTFTKSGSNVAFGISLDNLPKREIKIEFDGSGFNSTDGVSIREIVTPGTIPGSIKHHFSVDGTKYSATFVNQANYALVFTMAWNSNTGTADNVTIKNTVAPELGYEYLPSQLTNELQGIEESLDIEQHEQRVISFAKNGYFVDNDGKIKSNSNWYTSNVFRLYKNETFKLNAASSVSSEPRVIIAICSGDSVEIGDEVTPVVSIQTVTITECTYTAQEDCYIIAQYSTTSGTPSIINNSGVIVELQKDIQEINDRIDTLHSGDLPEYLKEEEDRLYRKLVPELNKNTVIFAFQTDQHFNVSNFGKKTFTDPTYTLRGVQSIVNIGAKLPLDLVVFGGDVPSTDGNSKSIAKILEEIDTLNAPLANIKIPLVSIPGNHDAKQNNANMTSNGMYNAHFKRSAWINNIEHSGVDNCDCYYDDDNKKIRYIFIDTWTTNTRTESYTAFLTNALSTMESGYKAIIFSHNPLTNEFDDILYKYSGSTDTNPSNAFANPTNLSATLNQYASSIIACICGHSHADCWGLSSAGILYIETTCSVIQGSRFGETPTIPYTHTLDSVNEVSFDFFVINLDDETIEAVRYGQGTNRLWKYKGTDSGLISYKNCVSGVCAVPSLTLVFTNTTDDTDVVSVACDTSGNFETYLQLGKTYDISCAGYTLDVSSVQVDGNKELEIMTMQNS